MPGGPGPGSGHSPGGKGGHPGQRADAGLRLARRDPRRLPQPGLSRRRDVRRRSRGAAVFREVGTAAFAGRIGDHRGFAESAVPLCADERPGAVARPGGQIVCQYYNFLRLGKEGYRKIQQACYDTAHYMADEIDKLGPFKIIYDGRGGIPAMSWSLKEDVDPGFNLFDLSDRIRMRGWQIAAYSMPAGYPPKGGTFFIMDARATTTVPADYRLLTAHETFPGHHLLDSRRWEQKRPVRRHVELPLFYEGWASFSEELLFDTGYFHSLTDRLLMAKRRFWRAMRGRVDLEIHTRRRSMDQAADLLVECGLPARQAAAMVKRYALKPGYQLAYTMGRRQFRRLYDRAGKSPGAPAAFARRILAQGETGLHHLEANLP